MISNAFYLAHPMINVLVAIYHALSFVHVPFALGFSIIVLTVLIRLILYPLTASQLKASKKMQELTPHISRLKEKHKNDAKMLQSETMRLYKEHGVNPAAGCLPVLIQLPIVWALYQVLQDIVKFNTVEINKVLYFDSLKLTKPWDTTFFGISLAQSPSHLITTLGPVVFAIPIITGILQFIQSKMIMPSLPTPQDKKIDTLKDKKQDDFATAFQTQSLYIFPIMIAFFAYSFPIGLSLYWNTFTIFGIIQQYKISGPGGLDQLLKLWQKKPTKLKV
jgi:YidC/Oxa1 family membrane protein insertase